MTPRALLAADCGRGVGLGHLERMLALADALRPEIEVSVLLPEDDAALRRRVVDRGHTRSRLGATRRLRVAAAELARRRSTSSSSMDTSSMSRLQRRLRARAPLAVVDDLGLPADCDLAVNPSPGGDVLRPGRRDAPSSGAPRTR